MTETVQDIAVADLKPSKLNPRRGVGNVKELAISIEAQGIIEPLIVTPDGNGGYEVTAGSRRLAAAKVAKLTTVPCIVRDLDDRAQAENALIENLQREDLEALDEANALAKLMELGEYSQRDLAGRIGRSQAHISKRLSLLELPKPAKEALDSGVITVTDAIELTKLKDRPERVDQVLEEVREGSRRRWGREVDVAGEVEAQLTEQRREELYADLRTKAQAKDVPFVEMVKDQYRHLSLPKNHAYVDHGYPNLGMKVRDHAKKPCHAVTVLQYSNADPEIVWVCTDAKSHPKQKQPWEKADDTRRKKKREHDKEKKKAQVRRREFVAGLLKKRLPKGQVFELISRGVIEDGGHDVQKIACQLLQLEPENIKGSRSGIGYTDYEKALLAEAGKGEAQLLRVALAVALARYETTAGSSWSPWSGLKQYFTFLTRHGYRRSDPERLELEGKAPRG